MNESVCFRLRCAYIPETMVCKYGIQEGVLPFRTLSSLHLCNKCVSAVPFRFLFPAPAPVHLTVL